jgi:hypothetical protein
MRTVIRGYSKDKKSQSRSRRHHPGPSQQGQALSGGAKGQEIFGQARRDGL